MTPQVFVVPVPRQRPRNRGHFVVLPNDHLTRLADVEAPLLDDGAPDQVLHHLHVHVVPRRAGDGFRMPDPAKDEVSREERREQASALRRALAR